MVVYMNFSVNNLILLTGKMFDLIGVNVIMIVMRDFFFLFFT